MKRLLILVLALAIPMALVGVGISTHAQDQEQLTVRFTTEFYADDHIVLTVISNGPVDRFNAGDLNLIGGKLGVELNQDFSTALIDFGESLDCDLGIQITGSASFELLEARIGQRWTGRALLGSNRFCFEVESDNDLGGDQTVLFQLRFRVLNPGFYFFTSPNNTLSASWKGKSYDPVIALPHTQDAP